MVGDALGPSELALAVPRGCAPCRFLVQLKAALGPGLVVSADIAVWTDFPWVNPKHPGYASLDYLNVMTCVCRPRALVLWRAAVGGFPVIGAITRGHGRFAC